MRHTTMVICIFLGLGLLSSGHAAEFLLDLRVEGTSGFGASHDADPLPETEAAAEPSREEGAPDEDPRAAADESAQSAEAEASASEIEATAPDEPATVFESPSEAAADTGPDAPSAW